MLNQFVKQGHVNKIKAGKKINQDNFPVLSDVLIKTLEKKVLFIFDSYEFAFSILEKLDYSSADIAYFSKKLSRFTSYKDYNEKAGLFMSALCNCCAENNLIVYLDETGKRLSYFGYRNNKKISVYGNVSDYFCRSMESGKVLLYGNCGNSAGAYLLNGEITIFGNCGNNSGLGMLGGKMVIKGDTEDYPANYMKGGHIYVTGSAGFQVGINMTGGEIIINGNAASIAY